MNIRHLELFYFVAKHGGIAAAVRNIPYGIQQPAVSGQIAKLEESLGTKLFQRRPFALSPAGVELFEFIKPFFDNVEIVGEKLRQNRSPQLRIAAPSIVLHDYIPELLQKLRAKFPEFRLYLHEAARAEAERLLLARDVDLAITLVEKKSRGGIQVLPLLELPLILLVHRKSRLGRAEELWKRDKIEETLIAFPRTDPIHASFQRGLERIGVEWFCGIEVNSARLIERYVAGGYGIGLAVAVPGFKPAQRGARFKVAGFSPGRCERLVVRQTFKYFKAIADRTRNRSASANAPNETWSQALVEVNFVAVADLITSRASATLQKAASSSPRRIRPVRTAALQSPESFRGEKAVLLCANSWLALL